MDDIIIPKVEQVEIKNRKDGRKYMVDLFISGAVGLTLLSKLDSISRVFNNQATEDDIDTMFSIFEIVLKRQHNFMTKKWCQDNLDMAETMVLTMAIAEPMFEYLKLMGVPVMPDEKNLEDENTDGVVM